MHRVTASTFGLFWSTILVSGILLCTSFAMAEEAAVEPGGEQVPEETLSPGEDEHDSYEEAQEKWSKRITSTASYMDTFFDNERYATTSNKTYVRLRVSPIYNRHGLSFNTYVDIRLLLPNTEKWLLNFGGDPDTEDRYGSSPLQDQERADSGRDERNAYLGVNSFFKRTRTRNIGFGGGISFRNRGIVPYGTLKWTELWEFKKWDLRAMQRLRYYTDSGPEFKSQLDAELPIAHKFFARASGSVVFKKDDPNLYPDVEYSLYQYLTTRRAIKYQVRTGYLYEPSRSLHLSTVNYEIQYRQEWRDWFYTNLTPNASQSESRDWKLDPGIRIDFNVRLGHIDDHEFKSAYQTKQENLELKAREDRDKALEEGHRRFMEWKEEQEKKAQESKQGQ